MSNELLDELSLSEPDIEELTGEAIEWETWLEDHPVEKPLTIVDFKQGNGVKRKKSNGKWIYYKPCSECGKIYYTKQK